MFQVFFSLAFNLVALVMLRRAWLLSERARKAWIEINKVAASIEQTHKWCVEALAEIRQAAGGAAPSTKRPADWKN